MADIDLLPLPSVAYVDDEGLWEERYGPYSCEETQDYARACVAHNIASLQAEIDALRTRLEDTVRDSTNKIEALRAEPSVPLLSQIWLCDGMFIGKSTMSEKPVASVETLARYEPAAVYIGTGEYVAECVRADDGDYYLIVSKIFEVWGKKA